MSQFVLLPNSSIIMAKPIRVKPSGQKIKRHRNVFRIHDNGGTPFLVNYDIDSERVTIYSNDKKLLFEYFPLAVFIGKSPVNDMTLFSGGHGPKFDGNSILIKIDHLTYVFIGESIFSFTSYSEIINYVSPVGNSDVPYPYAVDDHDRYYLMIEDVVIQDVPSEHSDRPYEYYYERHYFTKNDGEKTFKDIIEFYIKGEKYSGTYKSDPEKDYERFSKFKSVNKSDSILSVKKTDGKIYPLSKQEYIMLIEEFGNYIGASKLPNVKVIQEREW